MITGASAASPRRFRRCRASLPCGAGARQIRSAAGEGSFAALAGRNNTTSTSLASAAICSRRSSAYFSAGPAVACGQARTAPQALARKVCSIVHKVSRREECEECEECEGCEGCEGCDGAGVTMISLAVSIPAAISAGAYGRWGGAIHACQRPAAESRLSAGSRQLNSPIPSPMPPRPLSLAKISVRQPVGQPPPGSSRSSFANPLGRLVVRTGESWLASHRSGRSSRV